jgi:UDP-N-acetylglucosamine transferase subunit ALG13
VNSPSNGADAKLPLVFVTVGTDHHPFARLMGWVDELVVELVDRGVTWFVQHGSSMPPQLAPAAAFLCRSEMDDMMRRACAVVAHGGPSTIMESRRYGRIPIVTPRRALLGEHVDDHQLRFARRLQSAGHVLLAESRDELLHELDGVLAEPRRGLVTETRTNAHDTSSRFDELVAPLLAQQRDTRPRLRGAFRWRVLGEGGRID